MRQTYINGLNERASERASEVRGTAKVVYFHAQETRRILLHDYKVKKTKTQKKHCPVNLKFNL